MAITDFERYPESEGPLGTADAAAGDPLAASQSAWRIRHGDDPALAAIERCQRAEALADVGAMMDRARLEGALDLR